MAVRLKTNKEGASFVAELLSKKYKKISYSGNYADGIVTALNGENTICELEVTDWVKKGNELYNLGARREGNSFDAMIKQYDG